MWNLKVRVLINQVDERRTHIPSFSPTTAHAESGRPFIETPRLIMVQQRDRRAFAPPR
jgi:hypothetical protein